MFNQPLALPPDCMHWPLALPLKGHWLTGGGMVLSQLCVVLEGGKGGTVKEKEQEEGQK